MYTLQIRYAAGCVPLGCDPRYCRTWQDSGVGTLNDAQEWMKNKAESGWQREYRIVDNETREVIATRST